MVLALHFNAEVAGPAALLCGIMAPFLPWLLDLTSSFREERVQGRWRGTSLFVGVNGRRVARAAALAVPPPPWRTAPWSSCHPTACTWRRRRGASVRRSWWAPCCVLPCLLTALFAWCAPPAQLRRNSRRNRSPMRSLQHVVRHRWPEIGGGGAHLRLVRCQKSASSC